MVHIQEEGSDNNNNLIVSNNNFNNLNSQSASSSSPAINKIIQRRQSNNISQGSQSQSESPLLQTGVLSLSNIIFANERDYLESPLRRKVLEMEDPEELREYLDTTLGENSFLVSELDKESEKYNKLRMSLTDVLFSINNGVGIGIDGEEGDETPLSLLSSQTNSTQGSLEPKFIYLKNFSNSSKNNLIAKISQSFTQIDREILYNKMESGCYVLKNFTVGHVTGWTSALILKKFGKISLSAFVGGVIMIKLASHYKYIAINWRSIYEDLSKNEELKSLSEEGSIENWATKKFKGVKYWTAQNSIFVAGLLSGFFLKGFSR